MLPSSHRQPRSMYASASRPYILELKANDVLLGRGAPANDNEGNKKFRNVIQRRKKEYMATNKRQLKDSIARDIVHAVASHEGRFVRKIESTNEARALGVPIGSLAWVEVDEETAIQKVKQALRGREPHGSDVEKSESSGDQSGGKLPPSSAPESWLRRTGQVAQAHNDGGIYSSAQTILQHAFEEDSTRPWHLSVEALRREARQSFLQKDDAIMNTLLTQKQLIGTNSIQALSPKKQGVAHGLETASDIDATSAFRALRHALKRAEPVLVLPDEQSIPLIVDETVTLAVLCSHGMPCYDPKEGDSTFLNPGHVMENPRYRFTWADVFALVNETKIKRQSIYRIGVLLQQTGAMTEQQFSKLESTNPKQTAQYALMLLEKMRRFCSCSNLYETDLYETDLEKRIGSKGSLRLEMEASLLSWFQQSISQWAMFVDIHDDQGRTLHYSTLDISKMVPGYESTTCVHSLLDLRSCRCVLLQIASLTRLRSLYLHQKRDRIEEIVAALPCRPPWSQQGLPDRLDTLGDHTRHNMLLLEGLLTCGYTGILTNDNRADVVSGSGSSPAFTVLRQLGLSLSGVEEWSLHIILWLHERALARGDGDSRT